MPRKPQPQSRPTVGIIGLGFMGKMHFEVYQKTQTAKVGAISDLDPRRLAGDWSSISGNISGAGGSKAGLAGVSTYADWRDLLADPAIGVVDITLPTPMHAEVAVEAMKAGKDVICEKPIARTSADAKRMLEVARRSGRRLFVAHCIRFWPSYAEAARLVGSGVHGKVLAATFRRNSALPLASYRNWLQDPIASGACALDLHIHDTDFVQFCFGAPASVSSRGTGFAKGRIDHIQTVYGYEDDRLVTAEGSWEHAPGFPFFMGFVIDFAQGTLRGDASSLTFFPRDGGVQEIPLQPEDGYTLELTHFMDCLAQGIPSNVVTPESALESLRLVEAEIRSATLGRTVPFKPVGARLRKPRANAVPGKTSERPQSRVRRSR